MNFSLKTNSRSKDGIFGVLVSEDGQHSFVVLEHAYPVGAGFDAKLPPGVYTCVKGTHELEDEIPFTAFEVQNVPGHTGILIHVGNRNQDSNGCILIGTAFGELGGVPMILNSRVAFNQFMALQSSVDQFQLTVS